MAEENRIMIGANIKILSKNIMGKNTTPLLENRIEKNVIQNKEIPVRSINITGMLKEPFFYFDYNYFPFFRLIISGKHLIEISPRIEYQWSEFYKSIGKLLPLLDKKVSQYENIDGLTIGIRVFKYNYPILQYPVLVAVSDEYFNGLKMPYKVVDIRNHLLQESDTINNWIKNNKINGTDAFLLCNNYYIISWDAIT